MALAAIVLVVVRRKDNSTTSSISAAPVRGRRSIDRPRCRDAFPVARQMTFCKIVRPLGHRSPAARRDPARATSQASAGRADLAAAIWGALVTIRGRRAPAAVKAADFLAVPVVVIDQADLAAAKVDFDRTVPEAAKVVFGLTAPAVVTGLADLARVIDRAVLADQVKTAIVLADPIDLAKVVAASNGVPGIGRTIGPIAIRIGTNGRIGVTTIGRTSTTTGTTIGIATGTATTIGLAATGVITIRIGDGTRASITGAGLHGALSPTGSRGVGRSRSTTTTAATCTTTTAWSTTATRR